MKQDYSKYTDEMLIKEWEESLDLDECIFSVITELAIRKHPKTKQYCMEVLNYYSGDQFFASSALGNLYSFEETAAIDYAKENYKKFHIHTLGGLLSELWVDSEQENSDDKKELIKIIKDHLKTLKKSEIAEIQKDYDEFMKAYKNI